MKKLHVGIIGTGFGLKVHAPLLNHHPGFEVKAIASVHRKNPTQSTDRNSELKRYDDWRKMLENEELDLVSITSAPFLHTEMTLEALDRKLHVLCEKPLAMNVEQASNMLLKRDTSGCFGFTNFEFRFLPTRMKVKEILSSGILGDIMHVHYKGNYSSYNMYKTTKLGWLGNGEYGGGVLGAIGSHMIDSLLWWMETDIIEVCAQLKTHFPKAIVDGEEEHRTAEDAFHVIGRFQTGATLTTELITTTLHQSNGWVLEFYGTKGTLIMKDDKVVELAIGNEYLSKVELMDELKTPEELSKIAFFYPCFYPMLDELYYSLIEEKPRKNMPLFEDGYRVQRVLDAIRTSGKLGAKITL